MQAGFFKKLFLRARGHESGPTLRQFMEKNRQLYKAEFGGIVSSILLQPILLIILAVTTLGGAFSVYKHCGDWRMIFSGAPMQIFALFVPWLRRRGVFRGKEHYFTAIIGSLYFLNSLTMAYIFVQNKPIDQFPGFMFLTALATINLAMLFASPRLWPSFIYTFVYVGILYTYVYYLDPIFAAPLAVPFFQSAVFGCALNFIIDLVYRYRFFFIQQERILRSDAEKISKLFSSISHAIFQVHSSTKGGLIIDGERSAQFIEWFGSLKPKASFSGEVLQHFRIPDGQKILIESSLVAAIGDDTLAFDLNAGNLPQELSLVLPSLDEKVIQLQWTPLCLTGDVTSAILVSMTDVSALKKHKEQTLVVERSNKKVIELVNVGVERTWRFFQLSDKLFQKISERRGLPGHKLNALIITEIQIALHTLKGNARGLGFQHIAESAHKTETAIVEIMRNEKFFDRKKLKQAFEDLESAYAEYKVVLGQIGWNKKDGVEMNFRSAQLVFEGFDWERLMNLVENGDEDSVDAETFLALWTRRFSTLFNECIDELPSMARHLNKLVPEIRISGQQLWIHRAIADEVSSVLPHFFSNSMDHGIESPEVRLKSSKPERGIISIACLSDANGLRIIFSDDGRGIIPNEIAKIAVRYQLLQESEIAELSSVQKCAFILHEGFTSKTELSEIAGRGMGTSAVKKALEDLGGKLEILLSIEASDDEPHHLAFQMSLPPEVLFSVDSYKRPIRSSKQIA